MAAPATSLSSTTLIPQLLGMVAHSSPASSSPEEWPSAEGKLLIQGHALPCQAAGCYRLLSPICFASRLDSFEGTPQLSNSLDRSVEPLLKLHHTSVSPSVLSC